MNITSIAKCVGERIRPLCLAGSWLAISLSALVVSGGADAAPPEPSVVHVTFSELVLGKMPLTANASTIKAGPIEFIIFNQSRKQRHNFYITQLDKEGGGLATTSSGASLNLPESKMKYYAKFSNIIPLQTVKLTLDLPPGNYVIFCSRKRHFRQEGVIRFTVVK